MRSRVLVWSLLAAFAASLPITASAHAYLKSSTPADGASVATAPAQIVLNFTEGVEKNFSLFAVLPLSVPGKAGESAQQRSRRVHALAAQLADQVMAKKRGSLKGRVDTGLEHRKRQDQTVTIDLKENIPAGTYVLVWRAMAVDTHVTHGIVVFTVRP